MLRKIFGTITFGDAVKVVSGFFLGVLYFLSPVHDRVLYSIYGEGVKIEAEENGIIDPDKDFEPTFTISPTTNLGVSSGVLTWNISTSGETHILGPSTGKVDIEKFVHPRTFKLGAAMNLAKSGNEGVLSISFSFSNKFGNYNLGSSKFDVIREMHRKFVGKKNFTGTWGVHFLDKEDTGQFSIVEEPNRSFKGKFSRTKGFPDIENLEIRGTRDGQYVWFDVDENADDRLVLQNGTYEFDAEGQAVIRGTLVHCSPCADEKKQQVSSRIWMFAPYLK